MGGYEILGRPSGRLAARPEYVARYTRWFLKDYKERAGYNQAYNGISVMGMLTFDGTEKLVYSTFQDAAAPVFPKNQAGQR